MITPGIPELNGTFGRDGTVAFEASALGGPVARLEAGGSTAVVALQGAQVLSWIAGGAERLWLSPVSRLDAGRAVRGGIPICWPWFGPHPVDSTKPAHGFVRTRLWTVVAAAAEGNSASLTLETATRAADRTLWRHVASARLTITLARSLSLTLQTTNAGGEAIQVTQALHTYFRIGDIAAVEIEGLDGVPYVDKMDGGARKLQAGVISIDREVDRIYVGDTSQIALRSAAAEGLMRIESRGSRSAVIWNPWMEKAIRLGDMGPPGSYRQMICVETANAGDDAVTIPPGGTHTLAVAYHIA